MPNEREIFTKAREISDADERSRYLDDMCADDAALRERLVDMLRFSENTDSFLNEDALQRPHHYDSLYASGSVIGRYKLLEEIGEGGCGVVFMADQRKPVRRRVALKIVKPGMDTKEVLARFDAERQALALMNHPNVASIFDGGQTQSGHPYFVMELVNGPPITEFCDEQRLSTVARLELFVTVCRAVEHAHQKGIIHRDIKPSNVLVTLHDGAPVPKVIDFGIAKATNLTLTERTLFTRFGHFVGTPQYMSPEQAERSGLDVDTRSDVYSLGVLLYELLTGSTPIEREELEDAAYDRIRDVICTVEPPTPSTRLSTLGQRTQEVSRLRSATVEQLVSNVRGELDWITMKSLEKDRESRYPSVQAFGADVDNYLGDRPVQAGPRSKLYQLKKFMRRNRSLATTVGLLSASLLMGLVVSTYGFWTAHKNAQRALRNAYAADVRFAIGKPAIEEEIVQRYRDNRNLTGFELRWMAGHAREDHATFTVPQHDAVMIDTAITRDGRYAAVGDWDGNVELWDASSHKLVNQLQGVKVTSLEFSPDGKQLACSTMKSVNLYSVPELVEQTRLIEDEIVKSLCFSPDGHWLAGFRLNKGHEEHAEFFVWNMATGSLADGFPIKTHGHSGAYKADIRFSPDGKKIAMGSVSGQVTVIDFPQTRELWRKRCSDTPDDGVTAMGFTEDGKMLATVCGYSDRDIRLWNAETGENQGRFTSGHADWISDLVFVDDRLISSSGDGKICVWDVASRTKVDQLIGHHDEIYGIDLSNSNRLVSAGSFGTAKIWNLEAPTFHSMISRMKQTTDQAGSARNARFSADSQRIVTFNHAGEVVVLDTSTLSETEVISALGKNNRLLHIDRTGKHLVVETAHRGIVVWDSDAERIVASVSETDVAYGPISVNSERNEIVATRRVANVQFQGGQVVVIDYSQTPPAIAHRIDVSDYSSVTTSTDGIMVAVGHNSGQEQSLTVWNHETGRVRTLDEPPGPIESVRFSSDGSYLVACGTQTRIWHTESLERESELRLFGSSIGFNADDSRMILGKNGIDIWDMQTRRHLGNLPAEGSLFHAHFSPDGNKILATTLEGHLHVWIAPTWDELDRQKP